MMRRVVTIFILAFTFSGVSGQVDQEYSQTLKTMFEVSGTEGAFQSAITQMFSIFKQQYSNVEQDVWDELEKEFTNTSLEELAEMLVPVYQKYMT